MAHLVLQPGLEPFPGYTLKEKLGSGGYGEVWSADAPGGLTKAIKFVFGSIDDQRGSSELRSLNRMRRLNHPFLLSIERVEIVESQLVIVTELAQGTLDDRFLEYRKKGYIGIPRERLLRYLSDAADGLDYLCQEHGLQHLDVKPGNLLLVADRVKVADFGLIKNLQSVTQSARNGLTPTYAAPEMFDGRPSPSSDQYSLAIAYIELLSGNLPFRGRTCAQLANEHLNKAPNLESIPLIERPVVARALSKKPNMRFGSCREFMQALQDCRLESKNKPTKFVRRIGANDGGRIGGGKALRSSAEDAKAHETQSIQPQPVKPSRPTAKPIRLLAPLPPLAPKESSGQEKVLYIGLGGSGGLAIQLLRMRYAMVGSKSPSKNEMRALYFDTDGDSVDQLTSMHIAQAIPHDDTMTMRLNSSQYFRQNPSPDLQRVSRRWIFNIPRSQKTEGVRPLGMLAFLDNAKAIYERIAQAIEELFHADTSNSKLKVYLMASAHGGTGGAIVTEMGYLIRQIESLLEVPLEIQALLLCGQGPKNRNTGLEVASVVACLQDIRESFETRGLHAPLKSIPQSASFDQVPFDRVALIPGGILGQKKDWRRAIEDMVGYAWSLNQSELGPRLERARSFDSNRIASNDQAIQSPWLDVLGFRTLNLSSQGNGEVAVNRACLDALNIWGSVLRRFASHFQEGQNQSPSDSYSLQELTWTNELFRGQQLSVSAWVRRVIAAFSPAERLSSPAPSEPMRDRVLDGQPSHSGPLEELEIENIQSIATQLNYDATEAQASLEDLLRVSMSQLWSWLEHSVLISLSGWMHLGEIVKAILNRIDSNIERIQAVLEQLNEKRDSTLEIVYSSESAPPADAELLLETLSLETRFHELAAGLQQRLSSLIKQFADRWIQESTGIMREADDSSKSILAALGIEPTGPISTAHLPRLVWNPCFCEATKLCLDHSHARMSGCWNIESTSPKKSVPNESALGDMASRVKVAVAVLREAEDINQLQFLSKTSSGATEHVIFHDRFGWNSLYGDPALSDASEDIRGDDTTSSLPASIDFNLVDEFRRAIPQMMACGGTIRNVLIVGPQLESMLDSRHHEQIVKCRGTLVSEPIFPRCSIYTIGERIDLQELIEQTWPDAPGQAELTQRLRFSPTGNYQVES